MPSSLLAIQGVQNLLTLPAVDAAVVLLVDGLGAAALAARSGHARTLAPMLAPRNLIGAKFPTTTASALATLATGTAPGVHGLVGYSVLDAANDRVVNQLSGWDDRIDPLTWQSQPTVFETATDAGIRSFAIGAERYRSSGFTNAILRGAEYRAGSSIVDRFTEARRVLDEVGRALIYLYVPELDQIGHAKGWESPEWTTALETLDAAVREFSATLGRREGLLLTADHGVLDIPESSHVLYDTVPGLLDGIRFVAGEPRALQLYFEPEATAELRAAVLARWQESEGSRSWVVSRAEAIESGWFGATVTDAVAPRIGDIIVAARKAIAYYDSRDPKRAGRNMVGQHGSWSPEETTVPLLRFGAFAH
jgi:predicted AlkP superfamily pyrophosphatase or phosphodiesterase